MTARKLAFKESQTMRETWSSRTKAKLRGLSWFVGPLLLQNRGRNLAAIIAIAAGIALALAIHIVNQTAVNEFTRSLAKVNGTAQLQIRGSESYFDQDAYVQLNQNLQTLGIREASPIIEVESSLPNGKRARLVGLDFFRAAYVTPELLARPRESNKESTSEASNVANNEANNEASNVNLFDATLLYGARSGLVQLQTPTGFMQFRMAGSTGLDDENRFVGDIAQIQTLFGYEGKISRIDLLFDDSIDLQTAKKNIEARLKKDFPLLRLVEPDAEKTRMSNLSRAYRVNLTVLALVALVTGGLIVFCSQAAMVLKQWPMLALVSLLGASRRWLMLFVLAQGLVLGILGTFAGLVMGYGLAAALLQWVGTDLGGGYFSATKAWPSLSLLETAVFVAAGLLVSVLASWIPARSALNARRAEALKPGHGEMSLGRLPSRWPAIVLTIIGAGLATLPAIAGLPLAGYAAIACWLFAGVAAVPWLAQYLLTRLARGLAVLTWPQPPVWLALHRAGQSPGLAIQAIAGVVASMALVTAMAIMVSSFRNSVSTWLDQVLPADLYARLPAGAAQLSSEQQEKIAKTAGVARVEFLRSIEIVLPESKTTNQAATINTPIPILIRPIDPAQAGKFLPIAGRIEVLTETERQANIIPIYVSEAMVDLYQMTIGSKVQLPFNFKDDIKISTTKPTFKVVAVWRDYTRQTGAIQIDQTDYRNLTGDTSVSDVALWLTSGVSDQIVGNALNNLALDGRQLEWRSAAEIRSVSLTIFDRSFAVTYALEAAAIIVALIGVAASFGAQALARQKEFAVLVHLGAKDSWLDIQLALEGGVLTLAGALWGVFIGFAMSWVLIERVNPQSFHWTMDIDIPWLALIAGVLAITLCAALCSGWAGRKGRAQGHLHSIKQDW
jgi:putative ABC transport system permease protein